MENEGPYRNEETKSGDAVVFGPGLHPMGTRACWGEELGSTLNFSYAEGRKVAEKDFKELFELVNRFRYSGRSSVGLKWVIDFEHKFDAWKKARGIE